MNIETFAEMHLGDCLTRMADLPPKSVDFVLCDPPYGMTDNKWDTVIPLGELWAQYARIVKENGAIAMFSAQPFTTTLIASNQTDFRYDWVWTKNVPSGFANAHRMPMRAHETIAIFYKRPPTYNKQPTRSRVTDRALGGRNGRELGGASDNYNLVRNFASKTLRANVSPCSILAFDVVPRATGTLHPTQKPVQLCEYLIRTYTNEGETVLDNCMGSGTTGVACIRSRRRFIGIEKDADYFDVARARIKEEQSRPDLFSAPRDSAKPLSEMTYAEMRKVYPRA